MNISEVMTRDVEVARPQDTIQSVAQKMAAGDFGFMPVCDGRKIQGVVTDRDLTVRAIRIARRIMTAPAMAPLQLTEVAPGTERESDDEILDWVRQAGETTYHPVGTCKMGSDPMAVVDARLRVHGIAGLRVADASIMPTLTSGNTNAPTIMVAEKGADLVLEDTA